MSSPLPPLLDEASAAFIQRQVAIYVAARNGDNLPSVARAVGCRISPDRRAVTIFLPSRRAAGVLEDLRETAAIAVVITRPSTHQTLQLKGRVDEIKPLSAPDREAFAECRNSLIDELAAIGHSRSFAATAVGREDDEYLAVIFQPAAAFVQTPGPRAGRHLEPQV